MTCNICTENYTKNNRAKVTCVYCDFDACRQCCSRYIIDRQEANCMNNVCKKEWSRRFLKANFTKNFLKTEWRTIQEKKCLDKERALFPATMTKIEREKRREERRIEIKRLWNEEIETRTTIKSLEYKLNFDSYTDEEIQAIHSKHTAAWIRYIDIRRIKRNLSDIQANGGDVAASNTYNGRTCSDSNCRGLLSTQWKCATCEKYTCKECLVLKDTREDNGHVCKMEDVETAKLLASDTKPCPKCRVPIYKIMGCDQMWCTECHTGFSWRTGNIETRIHNPHFYEYQRERNNGQAPRNHGDMECGRTIECRDGRELYVYMREQCDYLGKLAATKCVQNNPETQRVTKKDLEKLRFIRSSTKIFHRMIHLQMDELPRYTTDHVANNEALRKKFLTRDPSKEPLEDAEKRLKRTVLAREEKIAKNREIYNVGDLLVRTYTDIMYRFRDEWREFRKDGELSYEEVDQHFQVFLSYFEELDNIVRYCNEILEDINVTYCKSTKSKRIVIDDLRKTEDNVFKLV